MFATLAPGSLVPPADSARAVAHVYTISLLALAPLVAALLAVLALRGAGAGARTVVWKSTIVALLLVCVGRAIPVHWVAWIVPSGLAAPLVTLGQLQLATSDLAASSAALVGTRGGDVAAAAFVPVLFWTYLGGVALVLASLARAVARTHTLARRGYAIADPEWTALLRATCEGLRIRRTVRLLVSAEATVPATWGLLRPVVLLPAGALAWSASHRRAVLLHELGHVRRADGPFMLAAGVACALLWFHPGVWLVARALATDSELACDDLVLDAGVRRSDYAELLMLASAGAGTAGVPAGAAVAVVRRAGLRERLAAIVDDRRELLIPPTSFSLAAAAITLAVALPVATARLAPTRGVLTTLMHDARWESRAYAVTGLAQRQDSVEVARAAARLDPSPRVRAWALYALAEPARRGGASPTAPQLEP